MANKMGKRKEKEKGGKQESLKLEFSRGQVSCPRVLPFRLPKKLDLWRTPPTKSVAIKASVVDNLEVIRGQTNFFFPLYVMTYTLSIVLIIQHKMVNIFCIHSPTSS